MEDRDQPWNFHTCKFCPYRSKSTYLMCHHVRLHRNRLRTDVITCYSETPEMLECESCEFDTDLKVNLKEHVNVFHENKEENSAFSRILGCYRCKKCQFQTYSLLVVTKHVNNCVLIVTNRTKSTKSETKAVGVIKWFECEQCESKFKTKTELTIHCALSHKAAGGISWYKCDHCLYKTNRKYNLEKHRLRCVHLKFKCIHCPVRVKSKEALIRHVRQKHCVIVNRKPKKETAKATKWFQCDHCDSKFKSRSHFKRHFIMTHAPPEDVVWFKCDHCFFKTKWKESLKSHSSRCSFVKKSKCIYCRFNAKSKEALKKHLRQNHFVNRLRPQRTPDSIPVENGKWFQCGQCDGKFKTKFTLKKHLRFQHASPDDIIWFKCDRCPYRSKRKGDLKKHNSRKFKCLSKAKNKDLRKNRMRIKQEPETAEDTKAIKKKVLEKDVKQKHRASKTEAKENRASVLGITKWFKCEQCDWKFKNSCTLKRHFISRHAAPEEITWFQCDSCPFKAKRKDCLKQHSLKCGSVKNFETVCGVKTNTEDVKQKPFVGDCVEAKPEPETVGKISRFNCDHCQYQSNHRGNLRRHSLKMHGSVQKFKAAYNRIKTKNKDLKKHAVQKHRFKTGNQVSRAKLPRRKVLFGSRKKYRCEQCGWRCGKERALKRHLILKHAEDTTKPQEHSSVKNFECVHCGVRSKTEGGLKKHVQRKHSGTVAQINCFKCDQCQFQTNREDILKQHSLECCSLTQKLQCLYCPLKAENREALRIHAMRTHRLIKRPMTTNRVKEQKPKSATAEESKRFKCDQCDCRFKSNVLLKRHFISKHAAPEDITWYRCDRCFYQTKRKDSLKSHSLKCNSAKKSKRVYCPNRGDLKPIATPDLITGNLVKAKVTVKQQFMCELCDYKFSSVESLKRHFKTRHESPENIFWYKCDRCWYQTVRKDTLQKHSQTCNSIQGLRCVYCLFRGEDKEALVHHVKEKHSDRDGSKWIQCERFLFSN